MNLTLNASGTGGHTVVTCEGTKVTVNFHRTDPKERGMITQLVEKGQKLGLKLHRSKKGEPGEELSRLLDVLMDSKGEIALVGTREAVENLACELVDDEIRNNRLVMEAQEDGKWKVLRLGDLKREAQAAKGGSKDDLPEAAKPEEKKPEEPEKKKVVTSSEKVGGG